jgi:hypothetical protein
MPTIIDGSAGITYPVVAGSSSAVQASAGKVLQVVNANLTSAASTASTTAVTTGLTATITPTSFYPTALWKIQLLLGNY